MAKPKSYHVLVYPEHGLNGIPVEQLKGVFKRIARSANLSRGVYTLRVTEVIRTEHGKDYELASFEKQPTITAINRYRFKLRTDRASLEVYVGTISVPLDAVLEGICLKLNSAAVSVSEVLGEEQSHIATKPMVTTPQVSPLPGSSVVKEVVIADEVHDVVSPSLYATDNIMNGITVYHQAILQQIHHYQSLLLLPHNAIKEGYRNVRNELNKCLDLLKDVPRLQSLRLKQLKKHL